MNLHEKQQFDFLLITAVERFAARLEQRHDEPAQAVQRLRQDPNGEGVWLDQFVDNIFRDFLLDNPEGSFFILCALSRRDAHALPAGKIADSLSQLARKAFADLLLLKTVEMLEQHSGYQAMHS